ncbi:MULTISPECIES: prepilin-type N-terminal cleavage/methylation domain-containing protein [Clostridium]|uniref:Type IV pilin N-term methylation site GFxxxE n=1 Tax=Clostridium cadaveris TaxID=1529 RepID=A0A1I2J652_9CLOT|nr:prepilin-type N-terminal cleavage/methylation domain-containing protein [Clostridium cadaveris]MDU4953566.1 prepilin-type N-terminal cleavage/methylation domain-containing protein [Clostridium sp.]MDY4948082.1 prepilin-type N-terminal cleavage/methylation domain-containing protein [Clostridium cadaveris]NME63173.1 prepilin-type N-terminal cleavage/methylation domain-containing protein [Clostridium cadaveris]NWK10289.1 prepilin-type N-terminal cleavage/methylation domain-containing protein [C
MKNKDNGSKKYKNGYTLVEVIVYLAITSIILVVISNFILSSLKVLGVMEKKLKNELYVYQGITYIDEIIDIRKPNKISKISENEISFINENNQDNNFKLIYSKSSKSLRIKLNVKSYTNNNIIRESVEDMDFKLKGNVLYMKIITTTGKEIEKSCAVKER